MNKSQLLKRIAQLNIAIDKKIIAGKSYHKEAVEHKAIINILKTA